VGQVDAASPNQSGVDRPAIRHLERPINAARQTTLLELLSDLADQETGLLEKSDYDALLALEKRRLDAILELNTSHLPAEKIVAADVRRLSPGEARLSGGVTREETTSGEGLSGWTNESTASWQIQDVQPGYYAAQLVYSLPPEPAPPPAEEEAPDDIIACGEAAHFLSDRENVLTATIEPPNTPAGICSVPLGILTLTDTTADIQLRVVQTSGGGMMNLKALCLTRTAKPTSEFLPVDQSASSGFDRLMEEHRKAIVALREPIDQSYLEQLQRLHEELETKGKKDAATQVMEEWKQTQNAKSALLAHGLALTPSTGKSGPVAETATALPTEEIRNLRGCRIVGQPEAGDRFTVRHQRRQFQVRLLFVRCPNPGTPPDAELAAYFKIDPMHIPAVADMARTLTSELLTDTRFTLITKSEPRKGQPLTAVVQIPAVGCLQKLIVAEGLGALRAENMPVPSLELEVFADHILPQTEEAAKRARRGAWQFRPASGQGSNQRDG
jgi:hypothetical protein